MGRRVLTVVVATALAVLAAGCASIPGLGDGGGAAEAEALLEQASTAAAGLESMTFTMRMKGDVDGQAISMSMRGGAYLKGDRIGDMAFDATIEGGGVQAGSVQMVMRDGTMYVNAGTGWQRLPGTALTDEQIQQLDSSFGPFDVMAYVKDVRVDRDTTYLGEPVTKIVGALDAKDFLKAMLGQLSDSVPLGVAEPPADVLEGFGDIRFVIYVSNATKLVKAVHESLTFEQDGHTMSLTVDMVVTGVNEPVEIPKPSV